MIGRVRLRQLATGSSSRRQDEGTATAGRGGPVDGDAGTVSNAAVATRSLVDVGALRVAVRRAVAGVHQPDARAGTWTVSNSFSVFCVLFYLVDMISSLDACTF